jgi:hypothetical protein
MKKLDLIKAYIDGIKEEVNELIKENGEEMYSGVFEVINELENDEKHWIKLVNDLEEDNEDEDEDFIDMILGDCIDRELMGRFGKQFGKNLIKLGYKYDSEEECWDLKDKWNDGGLTCYGVIWDYWYSLDTDVRESVSEIFEEEIEGLKNIK